MDSRMVHQSRVKLLLIGILLSSLFLISQQTTMSENGDHTIALPLVAAPERPPSDYDFPFTDDIDPWRERRWRLGAAYDLNHLSGCEAGRCGLLKLTVNTDNAYIIASPAVKGPERPYVIDFRARFKDKKDKHQYGVIFGADRQSGVECPKPDFSSCFTHYYEFRVRYRDTNEGRYVEYRIRRVDSHDGANQPVGEDLVEWTRADVKDVNDYIKWTVRFGESGHIRVKADNSEQAGFGRDSKYGGDLYFGVLTRTVEQGNATALFDSFKISADSGS